MYFFYVFACACGLNPAFGCQKKINVVCFVLFVNRLQSIRQTDWQTVKRIFLPMSRDVLLLLLLGDYCSADFNGCITRRPFHVNVMYFSNFWGYVIRSLYYRRNW